MSEKENQEPTKYKVLIEFIFKKTNPLPSLKRLSNPIQNRPFYFGLRIKNIDKRNTPRFIIKNLQIDAAQGGTLTQGMDEEFKVSSLNPGEEEKIWWHYPISTVIKGEIFIKCNITPHGNIQIISHQYNKYADNCSVYKTPNKWGDAYYVRGELEQKQATTNSLIALLTLLVFLEGVLGLDSIIKFIIKSIGLFFNFIGNIFLTFQHFNF